VSISTPGSSAGDAVVVAAAVTPVGAAAAAEIRAEVWASVKVVLAFGLAFETLGFGPVVGFAAISSRVSGGEDKDGVEVEVGGIK
jgi:hypothetical protein